MIESISFGEILPIENGIVFSSVDGEGLYFLEKGKKEAELLTFFPDRLTKQKAFYKALVKAEGKIFLSPSLADDIAVYDCETKEIQTIPLDGGIMESEELCKFWTSFVHGDFVYLIGHYYPAIVKLNIHTLELSYLTEWVEQIERKRKLQNGPYLGIGMQEGNIAVFPCCCTNGVLKLNLSTDETEFCELKTDIRGFNGICFSEGRYWLPSRDNYDVAAWDIHKGETDTLTVLDNGRNPGNFYPPLLLRKNLYLFSGTAAHAYSIDTENGTVKEIGILDETLTDRSKRPSQWRRIIAPPVLIEGTICFATTKDRLWHVYDPDTKKLIHFSVTVNEQGQREFIKKRSWEWFYREHCEKGESFIFVEEKLFDCKDFCNFLYEHQIELETLKIQDCRPKGNAGGDIYERLRELNA